MDPDGAQKPIAAGLSLPHYFLRERGKRSFQLNWPLIMQQPIHRLKSPSPLSEKPYAFTRLLPLNQ
jgi:hypothetical protein